MLGMFKSLQKTGMTLLFDTTSKRIVGLWIIIFLHGVGSVPFLALISGVIFSYMMMGVFLSWH